MNQIKRSLIGLVLISGVGCGGFGGARTGLNVPDVDRIAYVGAQGATDFRGAIRYVRTDITDPLGPHTVTDGTALDASWPTWRPDGTALAFSGWHAGTLGIFVVDVSLGGVVSTPPRLLHMNVDPNHLDKQMSWGTNGLIAFHENGAIFAIPGTLPAVVPPTRLTSGTVVATHPSWCADGQLAFDSTDATGTHVSLMRRDLTSTTTIAVGSQPSCSDRLFAVVLTRGTAVIFHDYQTGAEHTVIDNASEPVFGPGSTQIAFVRSGQIWVCDLDGGNAHAVTNGTQDREPAWGRVPGEG